MFDCTAVDNTIVLSSANACFPQLTSLAIHDCRLSTGDLESFLSLTPSLEYLKVISSRSMFDSIFDGSFWEQFIQTKLLRLDRFEFFFAYLAGKNADLLNLKSIIFPFGAPFWLNDKHWFVTCDYILNLEQLKLYTTSVPTTNFEIVIKYEASSMNGVRLLTHRWINNVTELTTPEVNVNFSLTKYDSPHCIKNELILVFPYTSEEISI
jgi:hypothetical protein